jgi:hypothetical protein
MRPAISQSIVFTYTNDLGSASAFFSDVMELELVVDQGACHIYRLTPESYLGVCNLPDRPSEKTAVTITIVTDQVDEWYEFLTSKGVRYERSPDSSDRFNVYSSLFISPHGYRIEIQRFNDSFWNKR